jgi:uncharacterized Zn finger protein
MFKCKNCGTEMVKVYAFEDESSQYMECLNCGNATKKRPIEYDDNGRLVTNSSKKKKNKQRNVKEE